MYILFEENYDIIHEREAEYAEFISKIYLPEMTEIGLIPVGAHYVEIGFGPRVVGMVKAKDLEEVSRIMATKRFKNINLGLKSFVYNYRNAILEPIGKAKGVDYTIQKGTWKLNQYYDLQPGVKERYRDFIINEHIPILERLDYVEVTGGWNVMIGGVSEVIAEFTFKDPVDIGRLLNNEDFRWITLKLRTNFVKNYVSRVLRCTERFDEPKWFRL
jgi:hypothetical protein